MSTVATVTRYHVGLRARDVRGRVCPFQSFVLAGQTFHQWTEKVTLDKDSGETRRDRAQGGYLFLTPEQVKAIRYDLDKRKRFAYVNRAQTVAREIHLHPEDSYEDEFLRREDGSVAKVGRRLAAKAGQPVNKSLSFPHGGLHTLHPWVYMRPMPDEEWEEPPSVEDEAPWESGEAPGERHAPPRPTYTRKQLEDKKRAELLEIAGVHAPKNAKKATLVSMILTEQGSELAEPEGGTPWAGEGDLGEGDEGDLDEEDELDELE